MAARRDGPGGEGREILSAGECAGARGPACTTRKSLASTPRKPRQTRRSTVRLRREGEEEDGEDRRLLEQL